MHLKIKQKFFSIGDKFSITDENDVPVYTVVSKLFSFTRKRSVFDVNGNLVVTLKKKLFTIMPTFKIFDEKNELVATIKRKFSLLRKLKIIGKNASYTINGDLVAWNYQILQNDVPIGSLTKEIFHLTDTYVLDIYDDKNAPFFVACALVIDLLIQSSRNSR